MVALPETMPARKELRQRSASLASTVALVAPARPPETQRPTLARHKPPTSWETSIQIQASSYRSPARTAVQPDRPVSVASADTPSMAQPAREASQEPEAMPPDTEPGVGALDRSPLALPPLAGMVRPELSSSFIEDIIMTDIVLTSYTVANLPASPAPATIVQVTDSVNTDQYSNLIGGGDNVVIAAY